jgi:hypothetical protein
MKSPLSGNHYKIADISEMTLRVYVSETQLSKIKEVNVKIDTENEMKSYPGTLGLSQLQNSHRKSFKPKKNE